MVNDTVSHCNHRVHTPVSPVTPEMVLDPSFLKGFTGSGQRSPEGWIKDNPLTLGSSRFCTTVGQLDDPTFIL